MTERTLDHTSDVNIRLEEAEECIKQQTTSKMVKDMFNDTVDEPSNLEIGCQDMMLRLQQMRRLTEDTEWLARE